MPALLSAHAKLARADVHLNGLRAELDRLSEAHAERVWLRVEQQGAWYVVLLDPLEEPLPPDLSLVCGDFVTNLRAALDHAVNDLVRESGHKPGRHTAFPIISSEKDWRSLVVSPNKPRRSPLEGLDPQGHAWAIIHEAQPYQRSEPAHTRLRVLNKLANRDKHQAILVNMAFPGDDVIDDLIAWDPEAVLVERIDAVPEPLVLDQRTEIVRLRFAEDGPSPNMHMEGRFPVSPTFGDERLQASVGSLATIRDYVAELLAKLAAT